MTGQTLKDHIKMDNLLQTGGTKSVVDRIGERTV